MSGRRGFFRSSQNVNSRGDFGVIFQDTFNRNALGGNYSSQNVAVAMDGSKLNISSTGSPTTYNAFVNTGAITALETFEKGINFRVNQNDANSHGFGFGLNSIADVYKYCLFVKFVCDTGSGNNGKVQIIANGGVGGYGTAQVVATSASLPYTPGVDIIELTLEKTRLSVVATATNKTAPGQPSVSCPFEYTLTNSAIQPNNVSNIVIQSYGGNYDVFDFLSYSTIQKNLPNGVGGDSITAGIGAPDNDSRYLDVAFMSQYANFSAISGSGHTSADLVKCLPEILRINPKQFIINIGVNDCRNAIPTSSYNNNLNTIVNTLAPAGIGVTLTTLTPQNDFDITPYNNIINTNFSAYTRIDINSYLKSTGTIMAGAVSFDGIHPNKKGHYLIASAFYKYARTKLSTNFYKSAESDADAFLSAAQLSDQGIVDAHRYIVYSLKAEGIWNDLLGAWAFGNEGVNGTMQEQCRFNLKNHNAFKLDFFGSGSFSYDGVKGNGTNFYANTHVNPSLHLSQDNSSMGVCLSHAGTKTGFIAAIGATSDTNTNSFAMLLNGTSPTFIARINQNTDSSNEAYNDKYAFYSASRTGAAALQGFRDGVSVLNSSIASAAPLNKDVYLFGNNYQGSAQFLDDKGYSFIFIGAGLTPLKIEKLTKIVRNFNMILGRKFIF